MVRLGESSMNNGASEISPIRRAIRVQSSSLIFPDFMSDSFTRASALISRMTISVLLISRENTTEDRPFLTEHERMMRSEEHTSELQSRFDLVCRLLLEKKKHTNRELHI